MKKIFVATPTTGVIADSQVHFMRMISERYKDEIQLVYPKQCVRRIFHDFARNAMVDDFMESDCDAMWFLDSDITPPVHILDLVTLHWDKWSLAGAPYPVFMEPAGQSMQKIVFAVYMDNPKGGMVPINIPDDGTDFVDGIATGCIFIKRGVIEKLKKPYFEFLFDPESRTLTGGEDIGFCKKVNALGYRFFIDYSMPCKHYKSVCLLDVNNYAMEFAKTAVLAYEKQIQGQVQDLVKAYMKKKETSGSGLILPGIAAARPTNWGGR